VKRSESFKRRKRWQETGLRKLAMAKWATAVFALAILGASPADADSASAPRMPIASFEQLP